MSALSADPEGRSEYARTKFEGEQAVRAGGLDWTIFRPGLIHGPDGEFTRMMRGWAEGRQMPFVFLPYFCRIEQDAPLAPPKLVNPVVAPVHVEDVVKAFADALETPESIGEVYKLTGPERITFPDMLRTVRDAAPHGKRGLSPIGIPGTLAALQANAAKVLGLSGLLPFDAGQALMGQEDAVSDNTKAATHLGFDPRAFTPSLREYISA
jgi:NADH dehydrogenase